MRFLRAAFLGICCCLLSAVAQNPPAPPAVPAPPVTTKIVVDRNAFTFTNYNLSIGIEPSRGDGLRDEKFHYAVMSHSRTDSMNCAVSASIASTELHFTVNKGCKALNRPI